jgi:hypothetical protein
MGKRPAEDEKFERNMGSIQREIRTSMQREDKPTMETGPERIAAKARSEPKLRFTSLAHHITRERVWTNLCQIPKRSAPGVDGQTVTDAKATFVAEPAAEAFDVDPLRRRKTIDWSGHITGSTIQRCDVARLPAGLGGGAATG